MPRPDSLPNMEKDVLMEELEDAVFCYLNPGIGQSVGRFFRLLSEATDTGVDAELILRTVAAARRRASAAHVAHTENILGILGQHLVLDESLGSIDTSWSSFLSALDEKTKPPEPPK
jgi:hypothetical protein